MRTSTFAYLAVKNSPHYSYNRPIDSAVVRTRAHDARTSELGRWRVAATPDPTNPALREVSADHSSPGWSVHDDSHAHPPHRRALRSIDLRVPSSARKRLSHSAVAVVWFSSSSPVRLSCWCSCFLHAVARLANCPYWDRLKRTSAAREPPKRSGAPGVPASDGVGESEGRSPSEGEERWSRGGSGIRA